MTETEHETVSVAPKCCRNSEKVAMNEKANFGGQRVTLKVLEIKMSKDREARNHEKTKLAGEEGGKVQQVHKQRTKQAQQQLMEVLHGGGVQPHF